MAIVVSSNLLSKTRERWLADIVACKYVMNGSTYNGEIQEKKIVGNVLQFNIAITKRTDSTGSDSITKVALYDRSGSEVYSINGSFSKKQLQGRYFRAEIELKEG